MCSTSASWPVRARGFDYRYMPIINFESLFAPGWAWFYGNGRRTKNIYFAVENPWSITRVIKSYLWRGLRGILAWSRHWLTNLMSLAGLCPLSWLRMSLDFNSVRCCKFSIFACRFRVASWEGALTLRFAITSPMLTAFVGPHRSHAFASSLFSKRTEFQPQQGAIWHPITSLLVMFSRVVPVRDVTTRFVCRFCLFLFFFFLLERSCVFLLSVVQ